MKCIGVLGGMSWESTQLYYRLMNEAVKERLGGLHSARIVLHSVDFHDIETRQHGNDWNGAAEILAQAASGLKKAGADFLVIATNTMHKVAEPVERFLDALDIAEIGADAEMFHADQIRGAGNHRAEISERAV